MQFDEVLRTWKEFFEREGVRYGVTGDLALRVIGWQYVRPRIEFAVDRLGRDKTLTFAVAAGYRTAYESAACSVHRSDLRTFGVVAILYAPELSLIAAGLQVPVCEDAKVPVVDPRQRFALSETDVAALETATMTLDARAHGEWFLSMCGTAALARQPDSPWPEPFEL